jgi:hypothetical protein
LRSAGIAEEDVGVIVPGDNEQTARWWRNLPWRNGSPKTFPQILIGGRLVQGGADGLRRILSRNSNMEEE